MFRVGLYFIYNYMYIHSLFYMLFFAECNDTLFECKSGRVDGQQPPCISNEQRCNSVRDCIAGEDELEHSCPCGPDGAVRLVGGSEAHEGRVELCRKTVWVTTCSRYSYWATRNAAVICRQLGYSSAGKLTL